MILIIIKYFLNYYKIFFLYINYIYIYTNMISAKNLYLQTGGYAENSDETVGAALQYLSSNLIKYKEYQQNLNELNELEKKNSLTDLEKSKINELKKNIESLKDDDILIYQTASLYLCMMFHNNNILENNGFLGNRPKDSKEKPPNNLSPKVTLINNLSNWVKRHREISKLKLDTEKPIKSLSFTTSPINIIESIDKDFSKFEKISEFKGITEKIKKIKEKMKSVNYPSLSNEIYTSMNNVDNCDFNNKKFNYLLKVDEFYNLIDNIKVLYDTKKIDLNKIDDTKYKIKCPDGTVKPNITIGGKKYLSLDNDELVIDFSFPTATKPIEAIEALNEKHKEYKDFYDLLKKESCTSLSIIPSDKIKSEEDQQNRNKIIIHEIIKNINDILNENSNALIFTKINDLLTQIQKIKPQEAALIPAPPPAIPPPAPPALNRYLLRLQNCLPDFFKKMDNLRKFTSINSEFAPFMVENIKFINFIENFETTYPDLKPKPTQKGGNITYKQKYLKYKLKYMQLKKII
jgi:translation elongation factor P/translation initiation factor 5A